MKWLALVGSILIGLVVAFVPTVQAQCPDGTAGDDNISCTGNDPDGVDGQAGNDTITVQSGATVNHNDDTVVGNTGDDSITNNGTIVATGIGFADGIAGGEGNNTIINNGSINAGNNAIEVLSDAGLTNQIINNGTATSDDNVIFGDASNDTIINNGTLTTTGGDGIDGFTGNDSIVNNGIINSPFNAIDAGAGDDTVQILVGSQVNGDIDGGGGNDTLIFQLDGDQTALTAFNDYITTNNITVGSGSITFNGNTYNWENFEQLDFLMTLIIAAVGGAGGPAGTGSTGPQAICEGAVKVFRLPNGDLQVYSGFNILPSNGFLVGYVGLVDVAAGVTVFQDPGIAADLGWIVEITFEEGGRLGIHVFDGDGNGVGEICRA